MKYHNVEEKSEAGKYNYKFDGSYGDYDVSISLKDNSFSSKCSCPFPHKGCKHVVAACLDIVQRHKREKKSSSDDDIPQEYMTPEEVREKAIKGRNDKAKKEDFQLLRGDQYKGSHIVRTKRYHDYEVTLYNPAERSGHCICPDFATNHLETCKHLIFAYNQFEKDKNFTEETGKEIFPFIHLTWNSRLQKPVSYFEKIDDSDVKKTIESLFNDKGIYNRESYNQLYQLYLTVGENDSVRFEKFLLNKIEDAQYEKEIAKIKRSYIEDYSFLKTDLYPYQKEGVEFGLFRKSAIIADEMGLGKTLQAISISILKKKLFGFEKVLIVSPSSLKNQWKLEIEKFTDEKASVVTGNMKNREKIYFHDSDFFKITNYEAVLRDVTVITRWKPDLIILDEAQRIKNFETKTHQAVLRIPHNHSLVITGTPLENKLEDIYSIVQFSAPALLTPLWAFASNHFNLSRHKKNKVLGYRNLDIVHSKLKDLIIRRRTEDVLESLPDLIENNYYLDLSIEQQEIHQGLVQSLHYYSSKKVLTPMDIKRMQQILLNMRRVCDSTYLVDKKSNISPKLVELVSIMKDLVIENKRKVIIFTEWTGMTYLIGKVLSDLKIDFIEFSGKIPVDKRQLLIDEFQNNSECMVFLSTDAGGTGLNLQNADCVINFELPWNPAKLNQRIGRINRIGQKSLKINVINLISKNSIEEKVLAGINLKQDLFDAVLQGNSDEIDMSREKKNQFVNQIRAMFDENPVDTPVPAEEQPELDDRTPHYLNPEIFIEESESELSGEDFENSDEVGSYRKSPEEKANEAQQMETVLNQGLSFLNSLSLMATGKSLVGDNSDKAVEIDRETGEVVMRFKLPGF
jgi:SNF2 family DNA or RNA helicase